MRLFSQLKSDLAAHGGDWFSLGLWAVAVHRFGEWRYGIRFSPIRKVASAFYKFLYKLVQIVTGIELPCEAAFGDGSRIDHFGGIVVSGYAQIGANCVLRQGVTLGLKNEEVLVAPKLGDHVSVGAGAKLLGDITIGDHVEIGANAVVLTDIPSHSIAVGIPARILPRQERHASHSSIEIAR